MLRDPKVWLGIIVSVGAMYWTFKDADFPRIFIAMKKANWWLLLISIPTILSSLVLRAYRWKFFIKGDTSTLRTRYDAVNIGFLVTSLLPLRLGELARVLVFAQKEKRSRIEIFATIAAERLFDVLAILVLFLGVLPFLPFAAITTVSSGIMNTFGFSGELSRRDLMLACGIVLAAAFGGFLLLCAFGRRISNTVTRIFGVKHPIAIKWAESFFDGLEALWTQRRIVPSIVVSVILWFNISFTFWLALLAFPSGDTSLGAILGIEGAVFLDAVLCAGVALPSAPGFFGVWHAATKVAFIPYATADPDSILAFAILIHLLSFILSILFGLESLRNQGIRWSDVKKVEAPPENNTAS